MRRHPARIQRHEQRLGELARISLELVESASIEAAASRLAVELATSEVTTAPLDPQAPRARARSARTHARLVTTP